MTPPSQAQVEQQRGRTVRNRKHWLLGAAVIFLSWNIAGTAQALELNGVVQWSKRVELGTPVSGVVVAVAARAGDKVKKGQLLVQLEKRALEARVKESEAALASLKRERNEAQRELDRSKELYDRTLLSNHDLEVSKIAYATANSRYQAASAALVTARLELEQSAIRAPFDGVVLENHAEVGQSIVSNLQSVPLVTMAVTSSMLIDAEAAQSQISSLSLKQQVAVEINGQRYKGVVTLLGLEPVKRSGEPLYPVQVHFATEGDVVRVGQPAKVIVP